MYRHRLRAVAIGVEGVEQIAGFLTGSLAVDDQGLKRFLHRHGEPAMIVDVKCVERIARKARLDRMVARGFKAMGERNRLLGPRGNVDRPLLKPLAVDQQLDLGMVWLAPEPVIARFSQ